MFEKYIFPLFFVAVFLISRLNAKPIEEHDTKNLTLDIPMEILNSNNIRVPTRWEKGLELLGQIMDAVRFGTGRLVNIGMMARNEIANRAEEFTSEMANAILSLIAARDARKHIQKTTTNSIQQLQKRSILKPSIEMSINITPYSDIDTQPTISETVRLENETDQGLLEVRKSNPLYGLLENHFRPTPVVDRTKEEDKYGNMGGIGRNFINGLEGLSNIFNTVLDFPGKTIQQFSMNFNNVFNKIGERLIGIN